MRHLAGPLAVAALGASVAACGTNTSTDYHPLAAFAHGSGGVSSQSVSTDVNGQVVPATRTNATHLTSNGFATSIVLVDPTNGATVNGGTVVVKVRLNGKLVSPRLLRRTRAADAVHLHFIMDGGNRFDDPEHTDVGAALRAQDNSGNQYTPSARPQVTYRGIPPGRHTIRIELVHDSHDPGSALSSASADFRVVG